MAERLIQNLISTGLKVTLLLFCAVKQIWCVSMLQKVQTFFFPLI